MYFHTWVRETKKTKVLTKIQLIKQDIERVWFMAFDLAFWLTFNFWRSTC